MALKEGKRVLVTVIVHEITDGQTKSVRVEQKAKCPKKALRFATGRVLNDLKRC